MIDYSMNVRNLWNPIDHSISFCAYTVYIDAVTRYDEACNVVRLKHYLHYHLRKIDGPTL